MSPPPAPLSPALAPGRPQPVLAALDHPHPATARPLRILYHHRIAASDGMRVHVRELVEALRARGHQVQVVGPGGAEAEQSAGGAGRLERLVDALRARLPRGVFEALELVYNLPAYARLVEAARAFRPDVIYERNNLFLLAGLRLRARLRLPLLLEVNAPLAAERKSLGQLQLTAVGERCEAALWRGADAVLPVTEVLARAVRQRRGGAGGVHVVPNGANLARRPALAAVAAARRRLGLPPDALALGFAGFVRAWHGVGWALEALAELPPETHLVIVGDGPELARMAARAEALGLSERLHLTGRVPHEEVAAYVAGFDVALQTAATPYASPLKLFEYMALGLAIVAPDQPNIREVLADGETALLFAPGDEADFRRQLVRLCRDAALRRALGRAAREVVVRRPFTWARNAERIETLARELVSAASAAPPPARRGLRA